MQKRNKLKKINIDLLQKKMFVINEELLRSTFGGYENDCFWRCIAYLASNGTSYGEIDAESYADGYFGSEAGLYYYGSAMSNFQMNDYVNSYFTSNSQFNLIQFDPGRVPGMTSVYGLTHVVVFLEDDKDSNGNVTGFKVFDPQQGEYYTVPIEAAIDIIAPGGGSPSYGQ